MRVSTAAFRARRASRAPVSDRRFACRCSAAQVPLARSMPTRSGTPAGSARSRSSTRRRSRRMRRRRSRRRQLYDDRERHFRATLEAFARAIDARDRYTAGHSERVTAYTLVLARAAGIADVRARGDSARVHAARHRQGRRARLRAAEARPARSGRAHDDGSARRHRLRHARAAAVSEGVAARHSRTSRAVGRQRVP